MFWPSSTSAARTRALSLHVLLGSKLLSVRGLWPLNTMFYADEHFTGQQPAAQSTFSGLVEPRVGAGTRRCCQNIPLHRDGLNSSRLSLFCFLPPWSIGLGATTRFLTPFVTRSRCNQ